MELTRMAPTGEAIGQHEGMVVFVPYGMPGDLVEVDIVHRRRTFARARISRMLRPSEARTQPVCKYFGICGGCEWQYMAYADQLTYKTAAVREQLMRIGRFETIAIDNCIPCPLPYYYRNHTQFVISTDGKLGYRKTASHTIVEVDHCPIVDPLLNETLISTVDSNLAPLQQLAEKLIHIAGNESYQLHLRAGTNTGEQAMYITCTDGTVSVLSINGIIHERIGEHTYQISPDSFFQVNSTVAATLVDLVISALNPTGNEDVLDLYSGVGLFTLPIAARSHFVTGVEANPSAAIDARVNARNCTNVTILTADVETALQSPRLQRHWQAIVIDPPRAGMEFAALNNLLRLHAARLVYVSCDPATLARDARIICDHLYTLDRVQPLDMFPQTHHVETVATFNLESDA